VDSRTETGTCAPLHTTPSAAGAGTAEAPSPTRAQGGRHQVDQHPVSDEASKFHLLPLSSPSSPQQSPDTIGEPSRLYRGQHAASSGRKRYVDEPIVIDWCTESYSHLSRLPRRIPRSHRHLQTGNTGIDFSRPARTNTNGESEGPGQAASATTSTSELSGEDGNQVYAFAFAVTRPHAISTLWLWLFQQPHPARLLILSHALLMPKHIYSPSFALLSLLDPSCISVTHPTSKHGVCEHASR
jgi:hypothetical protein